jgi:two-component system, OmpR family, osmolarity sensor histidine kinase EnvZ
MTSVAQTERDAPRRSLKWRFDRFLERHLPDRLYQRSLIIVIAPMVLLQAIMAFIIMERHWDNVTRALAKTVAREIAFVITLYETSPKTPEAVARLLDTANRTLEVRFSLEKRTSLPSAGPKPLFSLVDRKLTNYLEDRIDRDITVDTLGQPGYIDVRIQLENDLVLRLLTKEERAGASSTPIFFTWLVGSSLVLIAVAIFFLRKQIKPIQDLAKAARGFGMGRAVEDFNPRGAREVKEAATAFLNMKERIEKHVEQRTAMLAGVSHDIRTVLTRFKLEIAMLDKHPRLLALKEDVDEMQRMLEGYIAFVRGDNGESSTSTDVTALLRSIAQDCRRSGSRIDLDVPAGLVVSVKPDAFKRCVLNLVSNATRYAGSVSVTAANSDHILSITVDDDGPGVPPDAREDVFKPFFRLDDARNLDQSGTGLGLSIARDIARAHGGDVRLADSPLGGLRAEIRIPV